MSTSSGAHLTTSRINRLSRSLRAKCTALANYASPSSRPRHTVSVTYKCSSSHRLPADNDTPPLALLPPPDNLESRIYLDRRMVESFQLSKRIYEVRDAFRNILQVAFGSPAPSEPPTRVPSLAETCSKIIGKGIHEEVLTFEAEQADADPSADDDHTHITDELFEAIPAHHRSYAVASFALALVMHSCPHSPTLLSILLDTCLAYRLQHEARTVLCALLALAIHPRPTAGATPCPLAHPASSEFLVDLRMACTADGAADTARATIGDQTFVDVLLDVLEESVHESRDAWASKAVTRLARELRSTADPGAYLALCAGLARHIASVDAARPRNKKKSKEVGEEQDAHLRNRLGRWIKHILAHLHSRAQSESHPGLQAEFRDVVDFLVHVEPLGLHTHGEEAAPAASSATDSLVSLATFCLTSPLIHHTHPEDTVALQDILQRARFSSSTYTPLTSLIFGTPAPSALPAPSLADTPTPTPTPPPPVLHAPPVQALSALAKALRVHALPQAEAALWSSALRHLDTVPAAPRAATYDVALRARLAEEVEAAEARRFARGRLPPPSSAPAAPRPRGDAEEGEWEWEEMVGTWVRTRPAREAQRPAKRRRVHTPEGGAGRELGVAQGRVLRSRARKSEPVRPRPRPSLVQHATERREGRRSVGAARAPSSSRVGPRSCRSRTPEEKEDVEEEEEHAPRRVVNFASLLADAQVNCTVLHPRRQPRHSVADVVIRPGRDMAETEAIRAHRGSAGTQLGPRPRLRYGAPSVGRCVQELSSEDALNLFAISSPAVAR